MGVSSNGILAYGYILGGDEAGWELEGVGRFESLEVPWWNREPADGEDRDFGSALITHLLAAAGFTEKWKGAPAGYWERRREVEKGLGVEVTTACSFDYPFYMLTTFDRSVSWGAEAVDFAPLELRRVKENWDSRLQGALETLGLRPTQQYPQWLLGSLYG